MFPKKWSFSLIGLAFSLLVGPSWADGREARVRAVHASPDAPIVDVLVNDHIRAFQDLEFFEASDYASLPAGVYNVKVVPADGGPGSAVIDADLNLFFNRDYTVVALNMFGDIEPIVLEDDNRPAPRRKARVRFLHASPDAPPVDIRVADGPFLWQNVAFREAGDYRTVPAGFYDLEVLVAGTEDVVLEIPAFPVDGGTTYTVYAIGFAGGAAPALSVGASVDSLSPAVRQAPVRETTRRGPRAPRTR